jgi:hypothetical protein
MYVIIKTEYSLVREEELSKMRNELGQVKQQQRTDD